ncbi:MAG TPA: hypothetical protein VG713_13010, partial [Pirellulales bacterium]|nr:hypothetical protein [Pirellulales bacterium]
EGGAAIMSALAEHSVGQVSVPPATADAQDARRASRLVTTSIPAPRRTSFFARVTAELDAADVSASAWTGEVDASWLVTAREGEKLITARSSRRAIVGEQIINKSCCRFFRHQFTPASS